MKSGQEQITEFPIFLDCGQNGNYILCITERFLREKIMTDIEYKDVLYDKPTLDYAEAQQNFVRSVNGASEAEIDGMLEESLRQPAMKNVYAACGIGAQDVDKYIESVKGFPVGQKKTLLTGFCGAYGNAAISDKHENQPKVSGERENFALYARLSSDAITLPMRKFVEERNAAKQEEKIGMGGKIKRWLETRMPGLSSIAAGITVAVAVTPGLKQMLKMWDKETNAKVTAQANTQNNADNKNTVQLKTQDLQGHERA